MNNRPKVSILLPTYNRAHYLTGAIESVLAQTYPNWELLISDNCSSDSTAEIANKYAGLDSRILYWRNESNIGSAPNYNKCIDKASGDYIELFGTDDLFEPQCLQKLVQVLDDHPNVVIATAAKRHIDTNGHIIREDRPRNGSQLIASEDAIRSNMTNLTNWIISPVMYRSKYKGTGLDLSVGIYSDLDYWVEILNHGDLFYVDEILFNYRVHASSETTRRLNDLEFVPTLLRIAERHAKYLANSETLPYKVVIEKLLSLVDYSTNFLKLNFDSMLGDLGHAGTERTIAEDTISLSDTNTYGQDLYDFKRISYLSLLYALDLRKELNWLYGEYNHLNGQLSVARQNEQAKKSDVPPLNKISWTKHTKAVDELQAENKSLNQQADQLSHQLNDLLNSRSWRITAPLRMARKKISHPKP